MVRAMKRLLFLAFVACSHAPASEHAAAQPPVPDTGRHTLTIIGTNDLHGALERLPLVAGYVANVRAARACGA